MTGVSHLYLHHVLNKWNILYCPKKKYMKHTYALSIIYFLQISYYTFHTVKKYNRQKKKARLMHISVGFSAKVSFCSSVSET